MFEICEPRSLLAAFPGLPPAVDPVVADDSPAISAAAEVCETPPNLDCDAPNSDAANLGGKEPIPDLRPSEIVADEGDTAQTPGWNPLDAGPEPVWLSATLDELHGASSETASSEPSSPLRLTQNQPEESTEQESPDQQHLADFSASAGPSAVASELETERRAWTAAGTLRYPLADGARPGSPGGIGFPPPAATPSTGFLDVGRIMKPGLTRRSLESAPLARVELALSDAPSSSLATDLAVALAADSPGSQKTPAAADSARPSLIGENRGQRMMLLASTGSRPRKHAIAPPIPVPTGRPETSPVQVTGDPPSGPSGERGSETGKSGTSPAALGSLPRPPRTTGPQADDRVSRSTMKGIAAFVLLAAGLFSKSERQPRQLQQGLPDPGLSDAQSGGFRQGDADEG